MAAPAIDMNTERSGSDWIAPDTRGWNYFEVDRGLQDLLRLYLEDAPREHLWPHLERLGELAGGRLDELARDADRHVPVLHQRDRFGRDEEWIEFHPAYREMETLGFGVFGIHAMTHRPGVLGWPEPWRPIAKYAMQYLFVQGEFALMCPISVTDTSAVLLERYASEDVQQRFLPRMLSQDMDEIYKSAQFMTEKTGGSDVANLELTARLEDGAWRLYGEKWFGSCADADVALLLARPEGGATGTGGLGLFAAPRRLDDGSRNAYRIVRLKDKLGSRSMASGEIRFDGALAYPLGEVGAGENPGLKMMLDQVNLSRLSHGVRAAAMMRRCWNEAMAVARGRVAFGEPLIEKPLMRRQLMKLLLPTEQALSVSMHIAHLMDAPDDDDRVGTLLRILTPLVKFRACRDNIAVATGAMEVRGGNGYIEDWINPRLVRDAHLGVLWEGTSNINALDVSTRAIARVGAHEALGEHLLETLDAAPSVPAPLREELTSVVKRALTFVDAVGSGGEREKLARQAADALYHVTSAVLLAYHGAEAAARGSDARRLLLARLVIDHRLTARDPLAVNEGADDDRLTAALLSDAPVSLDEATRLLAR